MVFSGRAHQDNRTNTVVITTNKTNIIPYKRDVIKSTELDNYIWALIKHMYSQSFVFIEYNHLHG
jgi:hypothetical protein